MPKWAEPVQSREQLVLFPQKLDDAVAGDHAVRLFDDLLNQIDWSEWEADYSHATCGRPAYQPKLVASVLLYGLLCRMRSSRQLENALKDRIDFRWLAQGMSIDHSTLCEFRRRHQGPLKSLFVQLNLLAAQMGVSHFREMAFDGTCVRSNNRWSGSRTPEKLEQLSLEWTQRAEELIAEIERCDADGDSQTPQRLSEELADVEQRRRAIAKASEALNQIKEAGKKLPKKIPLTDPDSRIQKNKHGGCAPNYTPVVGVDVDSGLIISTEVLSDENEAHRLLAAVDDVEETYKVRPTTVLADQSFSTVANLKGVEKREVTLYSPSRQQVVADNPAEREDPRQPVSEEQRDSLPTRRMNGVDILDAAAFVYDEDEDCFWCPEGKPLRCRSSMKTTQGGSGKDGTVVTKRRYVSDAAECAACPLKSRCARGKSGVREVGRDDHQEYRDRHHERMATDEAKSAYSRRAGAGERPFAVIKRFFGADQFLSRGFDRVNTEWLWLSTAFNVKRLLSHVAASRAGPAPAVS